VAAPQLTPAEQLLLKEYESARELTYQIDELRSRLTTYFVTLAGVAVAGLSLTLKDFTSSSQYLRSTLVGLLFLAVAGVGILTVVILARLRRVQLEHFRIIDNIRAHFLGDDYELWNVVELSAQTLPKPTRRSGTYFWLLMIELVSWGSATLGAYVLMRRAHHVLAGWSAVTLAAVGALVVMLAVDVLYLRLAQAPARPRYGRSNPPTG
jgi:hypothetical protein